MFSSAGCFFLGGGGFFLALFDCQHGADISRHRRLSVKRVFSETIKGINAKIFWKGSYPPYLQTIFPFSIVFFL